MSSVKADPSVLSTFSDNCASARLTFAPGYDNGDVADVVKDGPSLTDRKDDSPIEGIVEKGVNFRVSQVKIKIKKNRDMVNLG